MRAVTVYASIQYSEQIAGSERVYRYFILNANSGKLIIMEHMYVTRNKFDIFLKKKITHTHSIILPTSLLKDISVSKPYDRIF